MIRAKFPAERESFREEGGGGEGEEVKASEGKERTRKGTSETEWHRDGSRNAIK